GGSIPHGLNGFVATIVPGPRSAGLWRAKAGAKFCRVQRRGTPSQSMLGKLFISQSAIDAWVSTERVDLQGEVVSLRDGGGQLRLRAASLFLKVSGDGEDKRNLIGRVKNEEAI